MVFSVAVHLDRHPDGRPRLLKDGSYRFEVIVESEGVPQMVVKGFRLPGSGIKIIPPATLATRGMYTIVDMDIEFEIKLKKLVMDEISNSVVEGSHREQ